MKTVIGPKTERLWLTLLNESYFDKYKIKWGDIIGYLVIKPEDLKVNRRKNRLIKHGDIRITIYPKTGTRTGKSTGKKRKMSWRQIGGFSNRYDFVYAGRDVVNQVGKIVPGVIDKATGKINKIVQQRIGQAIKTGGAEIERVAPKIIRGAIEEVYKNTVQISWKSWKTTVSKNQKKTIQIIYFNNNDCIYVLIIEFKFIDTFNSFILCKTETIGSFVFLYIQITSSESAKCFLR